MELTNISTIKQLMRKHQVNFSKALGQNFLIDPTVCPRIAELGGVTEDLGVLEIGPGAGVLTQELALRGKKVVAVELDNRLIPVLEESLAEFENIKIIQGDILKLNIRQLLKDEFEGMEVVVCANLPYYITSPIIMQLLEEKLPIKSITAMVQKEAGERICAPIPSREMGAITVSVNYFAQREVLFEVSSEAFMPAPKVDSSVIKLTIKQAELEPELEKCFFKVVKASFSQRRKKISNSLSAGLGIEKAEANVMLEKAGVDSGLRAEQMEYDDYKRLAAELLKG